jgi:cytochrome P450
MTTMSVEQAGRVFVDPTAYADEPRFHAACALLRRDDPVHLVDVEGFYPFWAVTRHADIMQVEKDHDHFLNAPRPILGPKEGDDFRRVNGDMIRTLIHMDGPDHKAYRAITADWFRPANLKKLEARMAELARRYVDRMAELGGECDFVTDVAVHYPLYVILSILGLPESDFPRMLKLTQELFGQSDPDLRRGETPEEMMQTLADFGMYFTALTEERRSNPTDDLASTIANARLDGDHVPPLEVIGYYIIIATAGHDTTSSTIAGGLHALAGRPDQLQRLRDDPGLVPLAVEEMIRWVSPVKQFMRTATEDRVVAGQTIAAGESVLLSYPSANRDEAVFGDADEFDVGRDPNRHVAFGFGIHYCLGAQLARMETRALYAELIPRLADLELAGDPAWIQTLFVGGLKRLPIRYKLR